MTDMRICWVAGKEPELPTLVAHVAPWAGIRWAAVRS